jgi:hypothetical protein
VVPNKNRNQKKDQRDDIPRVISRIRDLSLYPTSCEWGCSQGRRIYQPSDWVVLMSDHGGFRPHIDLLETLHTQVSRKELPPVSEGFDTLTIQGMISQWTTHEAAKSITQSLAIYQETTNAHMTGFRASTIYSFTSNGQSWPVVEWREDDDTEVLAIFDVEPHVVQTGLCSWLMHHGMGINQSKEPRRWKKTSISWSVLCISRLKVLFRAAQQLLGILGWSVEEAVRLYCQSSPEDCSSETYCSVRCSLS